MGPLDGLRMGTFSVVRLEAGPPGRGGVEVAFELIHPAPVTELGCIPVNKK